MQRKLFFISGMSGNSLVQEVMSSLSMITKQTGTNGLKPTERLLDFFTTDGELTPEEKQKLLKNMNSFTQHIESKARGHPQLGKVWESIQKLDPQYRNLFLDSIKESKKMFEGGNFSKIANVAKLFEFIQNVAPTGRIELGNLSTVVTELLN